MHLLSLTQMNGLPVVIGMYAIKMIEETSFTPEADRPSKGRDAPVTTQPVAPPSSAAPVPPVVCSTITFHDDKKLVVKETVDQISAMSGPLPHSV